MFSLNLLSALCVGLGICLDEGHPPSPPVVLDSVHCQRRTPDCLRREQEAKVNPSDASHPFVP